jgi:type II secretion system protein N
VFITGVFAYSQFPSDIVQKYLVAGIAKADKNLHLKAERAGLSFPPGLKLQGVTIEYPSLPEKLNAEYIKVSAGILSLITMNPEVKISSGIFGGKVTGTAIVEGGKKIKSGECEISGLKIENIADLVSDIISGYSLTGVLSGKGSWSDADKAGGNGTITINNLVITLDTPFFSVLEGATFNEVVADLVYTGSRLQIKKCEIKGLETDGSITGSITVRDPIDRSILSLAGVIAPKRAFLEELDKRIPVSIETLIGKNRYQKGTIPFRLTGKINDPKFSMR